MKKSLAIVGLLACSPVWAANGLSYNYVQLDWIANSDVEIEAPGTNLEGDGDGFGIQGVFSFTDMLFIQGSYADTEADVDGTINGAPGSANIDGQTLTLGVGAHSNAFTGGVDLFGVVSYVDVESGGAEEDGFGIEIGARTLFMPALEGYISYAYADIGDGDSDGFSVGGVYEVMPNWGIGAEYAMGESEFGGGSETEADTLTLSARFNF